MNNALLLRRRGMMAQKKSVDKFLTFTASPSGSVMVVATGTPPSVLLEYSLDGIVWQPYTIGDTITLANDGDFVKFKGNNARFSSSNSNYNTFKVTGDVIGSGDITSILNGIGGDFNLPSACFFRAFFGSSGLIIAPNLPSLNTVYQCYYQIYEGCSKLKSARIEANNIATNSIYAWLRNVSTTGQVYCKQNLNIPSGISGIPSGWTRVDI